MSDSGVILCVDDDSTVLGALRTLIAANLGSQIQIELAESGEEALEIEADLRAQGVDLNLVISDFMMPGLRGDELLVRLHETSPNTIKILLTGQSDLSGVKRAINDANLYRFLEKPFQNEDILLTVRGALRAYQQERSLIEQNEALKQMNADLEALVTSRTLDLIEKNRQLEVLSTTDKLTGLLNRRKLEEVLDEELARVVRYGVDLTLVMIDIDHFKQINDTHGHAAGDSVLVKVAQILNGHTRDIDAVGRWGGEEFLILFRHTAVVDGKRVAEKLCSEIGRTDFGFGEKITASFGVASCRGDECGSSLLARADAALYRAKAQGRDQVETDLE